jgi:hypothetical protein
MKIIINTPAQINDNNLNQIINLIIQGGQVTTKGLLDRIQRADFIAYKLEDNKVICTASLKNPNKTYIANVFDSAEIKKDLDYKKELGYIATHKDFENKGHCQELLKIFFDHISNNLIFATTRKPSMIHILEKFEFTKIGKIYNNNIQLLIYNNKKQ